MAIDTSKPHVGRIYDYMLGGHHNYEADRQAAATLLKVFPTYPKWAKLNRWFLQFVASQWKEEGHNRLLDLASGLPTAGHFNEARPDAKILFTDNDPLSVAYGNETLKDHPDMKYVLADVDKPEIIAKEATAFFGADRRVAIGLIGVAYLVPDDVLARVMRALHSWCARGSVLAITFVTEQKVDGEGSVQEINATYQRVANVKAYLRSQAELVSIAAPWQLQQAQRLQDWLGVPDFLSPEELRTCDFAMLGAFFTKD